VQEANDALKIKWRKIRVCFGPIGMENLTKSVIQIIILRIELENQD